MVIGLNHICVLFSNRIYLKMATILSVSTTTIINGNVTVIHVKEQRKCGLCGQAGHNRTNRQFHPEEIVSSSRADAVDPAEPTVTYWHPDLFSGGGVMALPAVVGWRPGTDSLAYHAQMKQMFMYRFDQGAGVWRRT